MSIFITDSTGRVTTLPAAPERTLAQAAMLSGHWRTQALCSGMGRCGRCRVRFLSTAPAPAPDEARVLTEFELAEGWRLGCRHAALAGSEVLLPLSPIETTQTADAQDAPLTLAVDLGTTSIHWQALNQNGEVVAQGSALNPQMGAGSEVMSRLAFAAQPGGAEDMRRTVLDHLRGIVAALPGRARRLSVAGNPAMTLLLLGAPISGLAAAPYLLEEPGGRVATLADDLPEAYILPQLAPFVGGDLSAGMAALLSASDAPAPPFLLCDMGTNGEFLLALPGGDFLSASVPLGPALEGAGLACGNVAGPGAVSSWRLAPTGLEARCIGGAAPSRAAGITGAGYLSLMAILCEQGLLDRRGGFGLGSTPLAARLARQLDTRHGETRLNLPGGLFLAASDVEELLKVKAAFDLAVSALLREAGLASGQLTRLCLAGALGEHVAPRDLETLGFLPPGLAGRVAAVGNTSLAGARLVLADPAVRSQAESLPQRTRNIDLTGEPTFGQEFVRRMWFGHGPSPVA